jgi:RNA polymerase sigma-70 factor (ECF subfamily)
MPGSREQRSVCEWLEHQAWVRELARRLVSDPALAEDVAQEAWVAALESPHGPPAPVERGRAQAWLAAVTRNAARQLRRSEGRRGERERLAARGEALPSTAELLERAALQRRVVEAVEGLAEPYRSTLLLRYLEELPPREIARRAGVPVETVRTRVARGIEQLRTKLDREFGERGTWVSALAPLVRGPSSTPAPAPPADGRWSSVPEAAIGVTLVNTKLVLGVVGASALGLGSWLLLRPASTAARPAERAPSGAPAELAEPSAPALEVASLPPEPPRRALAPPAPRPTEAVSAVPSAAPSCVGGRVLDAEGRGLAGVAVELQGIGAEPGATPAEPDAQSMPARELATSGEGGRFELETVAAAGRVSSADAAWATVFGAHWSRGQEREPLVVVAPSTAVSGEVIDEEGNLVGGVSVAVAPPADLRARLGVVLDEAFQQRCGEVTGADGAFDLDSAALVAGAVLTANHPEFLPHSMPLADVSGYLVIQLERPELPEDHVGGIVLDPNGAPVAGAYVALGADAVRSGEDGRFALELGAKDSFSAMLGLEPATLTAVRRGYLPAVFEAPPADPGQPDGARAWPRFVTLLLGGQPLSLAGVVTDHRGEPVEDALVWVADPTFFGAVDGEPASVEHVLNGVRTHWATVEVDERGRFLLEGLLARDYLLRAMDPSTLVHADFGPFAAGSEVTLDLPTDRIHPRVAGRVVSQGGAPIAGATVHPMCDTYVARVGGQVIGTSHSMVEGTTTDAEGRFELENVPVSLVYLRVEGESILPLEFGRVPARSQGPGDAEQELSGLPGDSILELEIRVESRAHLRVELRDAAAAERFAVLDAAGEPVILNLMLSGSRRESTEMPIREGGRSDTLALSDTGTTLVLYKGGAEVGRLPLALVPGEVTTVTF